jgi:hypothetical protein
LVSKPKITIWVNFVGFAMENLGTFYDHLSYFTTIGNPFGIFCGHLVNFSPFWYFVPTKKNLATLATSAV